MINDRRLYLAAESIYAIWFDGGSHWFIGRAIDVMAGSYNGGYVYSVSNSPCPDFRGLTREWTGEWTVNANATISCVGCNPISPARKTLSKTLATLTNEWRLSFSVRILGLPQGGFSSVIHVIGGEGANGNGNGEGKMGSRNPAIYMNGNSGTKLLFRATIGNNNNKIFDTEELALNEWITVEVVQKKVCEKFIQTTLINGEVLYSEENTVPQTYENVELWASDDEYHSADVELCQIEWDNLTPTSDPCDTGSHDCSSLATCTCVEVNDFTVIEWETHHTQPNAPGGFGFSAYDGNHNLLYQRIPSHAAAGESDRIVLASVAESITFETWVGDGFYGLINVTINGEIQVYECIDCVPNSPSTTLGMLYLDTNMDGPQDEPGASNCRNTCTFIKSNTNNGKTKVRLK